MDSKLLVGLIKEVVKNEVKQQVKEELAKLIKSGAVTLNSQKKPSTPSLKEMTEVASTPIRTRTQQYIQQQPPVQIKEYTKNPALNEVLSMTTPFTAEQRKEGAQAVGSVLDMLKPQMTTDGDWDTMDYRGIEAPQQSVTQQFQSTGDSLQDATIKALTRDYSALTKVFAKQEQEKRSR